MSTTRLPDSAALALWFSAWASGTTSLDDARDAVVAGDAAHDVLRLPGAVEPVPLILAFGRLRGLGASAAGLALPVSGDPLGLAGPAAFNTAALETGEALVLEGVDLGLVPHRTGRGVAWACHDAFSRRQLPDPSEADTGLRRAVIAAAEDLADLDVARWRPEVADKLMSLRAGPDHNLPGGVAPRSGRLVALALRCRTIVDLALQDDGAAVSARQARLRREALTPLDRAARRGLVAGCTYPVER